MFVLFILNRRSSYKLLVNNSNYYIQSHSHVSKSILGLSIPCHLSLLLLEAVLLVKRSLVLLTVEGDLVAAVKDSNVLDRLDKTESEPLTSIAAVNRHVLYVSAL